MPSSIMYSRCLRQLRCVCVNFHMRFRQALRLQPNALRFTYNCLQAYMYIKVLPPKASTQQAVTMAAIATAINVLGVLFLSHAYVPNPAHGATCIY